MSHATASIVDPSLGRISGRLTAQMHIDSPLGPMLLARTEQGMAGAWFDLQKHHPGPLDAPERSDVLLDRATSRLAAYFAGEALVFDLPLDLLGTAFQRAVWAELLRIDRGSTCSYGDIARRIGRPAAGRAVGAAVGRNPVSIIVPCHRVVGSDGSLTGYAGGLHRKTALLRLEAGASGLHSFDSASQPSGPMQLELH